MWYASGDRYEGTFKDDKKDGTGNQPYTHSPHPPTPSPNKMFFYIIKYCCVLEEVLSGFVIVKKPFISVGKIFIRVSGNSFLYL